MYNARDKNRSTTEKLLWIVIPCRLPAPRPTVEYGCETYAWEGEHPSSLMRFLRGGKWLLSIMLKLSSKLWNASPHLHLGGTLN